GTQAAVNDLLMNVWNRAVPKAIEECAALQAIADQESPTEKITIAPWDWRYYAEKVRKARYDLDEAAIKPYLSLQNMVEAAFDCAQRLFGITLTLRTDIPTYHPDVKVYEVRDANRLIGLFLHDNFARPSKQGGAWMSSYRLQSRIDGDVLPIVANHNNFAKGAEGSPTLLSIDDAETLFHEFGHGLHGLLSSVRYEHLSGTNVLRDFVELPSQLYEHWLMVPEVMKRFARHYQTGEPIPDELIAKIKAAATFNAGFDAVEFTASALVDMALHAQQDLSGLDISAFEQQQLTRLGMPSAIQMRHRLPHFLHLFAGDGYAAAYYAYLWAEVLDADAFEAFSEAGNAFDSAVATRLHHYIYSSGGSLPPMEAYRAFRGRLPAVDAMLKKKGLLTHPA
ncbi:MAG: peptidase M3, partial [Betaproteobacteria bacterium]|nr:peptidase M3 [Betaproteobacteria bacterium]